MESSFKLRAGYSGARTVLDIMNKSNETRWNSAFVLLSFGKLWAKSAVIDTYFKT